MTIPRMETLPVSIDRSSCHPLRMGSSESFSVDFTGGVVREDELIGMTGDFYLDPMFRGGTIRFTAVLAGAILRLLKIFAPWSDETRRGDDSYQVARPDEIAVTGQEAVLWVERAGAIAN